MKTRKAPIWLIASLALAGCAASGESGDRQSVAAEEGSDDEVICRRVETTGSHFRRRVCMTRREFAEVDEGTQEFLEENRGQIGGSTGSEG